MILSGDAGDARYAGDPWYEKRNDNFDVSKIFNILK